MKKIKKILTTITVMATIFNVNSIGSVHAVSQDISDTYFGMIEIPENCILLTNNKGKQYLCDLTSENYMKMKEINYSYGIILELEQGLTADDLNLEYKFSQALLAPAVIGSNSYCYQLEDDISEEEIQFFSEYAGNLRKTEGVIRAELYRNVCGMNGCFEGASKNGALILLNNSEKTLDIESLNSDTQLQEYMKAIGADAEIKIENYEYYSAFTDVCNIDSYNGNVFAITGIDNREKIVEICDMLNSFDVINNSAFIPVYWQPAFNIYSTSYSNYEMSDDVVIPEVTTTEPTLTTPVETTATTVTTITTQQTELPKPVGDANGDNEITVRDCSYIAVMIASSKTEELSKSADFNKDGKVNVRDAAAIAKNLAEK